MGTHSSVARRAPWTEGPGGLLSMGLQRFGQDLVTEHIHTDLHKENLHNKHHHQGKPLGEILAAKLLGHLYAHIYYLLYDTIFHGELYQFTCLPAIENCC